MPKIVLNVDTGVDDALGIFLALRSPEVDVIGITATAGNVGMHQVADNTQLVLEIAGRTDVPVAMGATAPLVGKLATATFYNGKDGLGGLSSPPRHANISPMDADTYLRWAADTYGGDLIVVSTGPLTNLALALAADPRWGDKVGRIVVMGGAITVPGNVTPCAEYNIWCDPEAAQAVFASGLRVLLVGLDVTEKALVFREDLVAWRTALAERSESPDQVPAFALRLLDFYTGPMLARASGAPMYDPLAVAAAIAPTLISARRMFVQVETGGSVCRGQTVGNRAGTIAKTIEMHDTVDIVGVEPVEPNIDVALDVDSKGFIEMLRRRVLAIGN